MWNTLTDNLPVTITTLTALAGLAAAWLKLRPRRLWGWLAAIKERELLMAAWQAEKEWTAYYKTLHDRCQDELERRP